MRSVFFVRRINQARLFRRAVGRAELVAGLEFRRFFGLRFLGALILGRIGVGKLHRSISIGHRLADFLRREIRRAPEAALRALKHGFDLVPTQVVVEMPCSGLSAIVLEFTSAEGFEQLNDRGSVHHGISRNDLIGSG